MNPDTLVGSDHMLHKEYMFDCQDQKMVPDHCCALFVFLPTCAKTPSQILDLRSSLFLHNISSSTANLQSL